MNEYEQKYFEEFMKCKKLKLVNFVHKVFKFHSVLESKSGSWKKRKQLD